MKKIMFALLFVSTITSAFATSEKDINKRASASFSSDFHLARNVSWNQSNRFTVATFTMNDKIMYAYYDLQGQYVGTVRNIKTDELPVALSASLKKQFANYWITDLFELNNDQDASYFVRVEDAAGSRVLRSTNGLTWETYNVALPQSKM